MAMRGTRMGPSGIGMEKIEDPDLLEQVRKTARSVGVQCVGWAAGLTLVFLLIP